MDPSRTNVSRLGLGFLLAMLAIPFADIRPQSRAPTFLDQVPDRKVFPQPVATAQCFHLLDHLLEIGPLPLRWRNQQSSRFPTTRDQDLLPLGYLVEQLRKVCPRLVKADGCHAHAPQKAYLPAQSKGSGSPRQLSLEDAEHLSLRPSRQFATSFEIPKTQRARGDNDRAASKSTARKSTHDIRRHSRNPAHQTAHALPRGGQRRQGRLRQAEDDSGRGRRERTGPFFLHLGRQG